MQRDILTKEKIKLDYKKQFYQSIKIVIIMPIILTLLLALIIYLFSRLDSLSVMHKIQKFLFISIILLFIFISLNVLYDSYKEFRLICTNKFHITTDTLIDLKEKRKLYGNIFLASFSRPYVLNFASYGQYCIPEGTNHNSSEAFSMNDKGVFNCSKIGDTFYLVICNNKIALAYNTKLFELQQ